MSASVALAVLAAAAFASIVELDKTPFASPALLVHALDNKTWYGCSAIALQNASDPVLMLSTWVYKPDAVVGYRPSRSATKAAWIENTSRDYTYQTLYVTSASAPLAAGAVDSVALWNQKPDGITGVCTLVGFNSREAPSVDAVKPGQWTTNFSMPCTDVNLWVPFSRFDISADGTVAAAWVQAPNGTVALYGLNGRTGAIKWTNYFPAPPGAEDYWLSYGTSLSRDGRFQVVDTCNEGTSNQTLTVLNTGDGSVRGTVQGSALVVGTLSPTGDYIVVSNAATPVATIMRWDGASYVSAGDVTAPLPEGAQGEEFYLVSTSFGLDEVTGRTIAAIGWVSITLNGDITVGVWDCGNTTGGLLASFTQAASGSNMAVDDLFIDCAGHVCAVALQTQVVNGTTPTTVVLSGAGVPGANAGPVFTHISVGTQVSAAVTLSSVGGADVYYVASAGCTSYAQCEEAGAEAFLWAFTGL
jgi:hypothetical protein